MKFALLNRHFTSNQQVENDSSLYIIKLKRESVAYTKKLYRILHAFLAICIIFTVIIILH